MRPIEMALFFALIVLFSSGVQGWLWPWSSKAVVKKDPPNLNWVVDQILASVNNAILEQHGQELAVPGSNISWHQSLNFYVLGFEAYGSAVSKEDAKVGNLSTITRISDAGILQEAETDDLELVTLQAEIRVEDLEVTYSSIDVAVWFVTYSGGLTVKCPDNVFDIAIQFDNGESCTSTVKSAVIKKLSRCTVELEKSGVINWIKKHIISTAFKQILENIADYENEALPNILETIMQKNELCKFLNPATAS